MSPRFEVGPEHEGGHPFLVLPETSAQPRQAVLVLHGGAEHGLGRTSKWAPPLLRMLPFARAVNRRGDGAAYLLRDAVRGYNAELGSPVRDAQWALERIRELHPGTPIALVGHSMGGRVALELAGEPDVQLIVGLAPWIPEQYDVEPFVSRRTMLIHGSRDRVTDPRQSRELVRRIAAAGGDATFVAVPDWHAMMTRPRRWHHLVSAALDRPAR